MENLSFDQGLLKAKLTRFSTFINKIQPKENETLTGKSKIELRKRLNAVEAVLTEYEILHNERCKLVKDCSELNDELTSFENTYFSLISIAEDYIETQNSRGNTPNGSISIRNSESSPAVSLVDQHSPKTQFLNLPKINLIKFSGNSENWLQFRTTFESMIHKNNQIDNIQRLHYLKGSLVGDASHIISTLEFKPENYDIAWQTVVDRYDQPKQLIKTHLNSILELEIITKESSTKLRKFSDSLFKNVNASKSFANVEQLFEAMIILIVSNKLDSNTYREWESTFNKSNKILPSLEQFREFLQNHAGFLENLEQKKVKVPPEKQKYVSKSFVTTNITCYLCKKDHFLSKCDILIKLDVKQRIEKVKQLAVCRNCLFKGHFHSNCKSRYSCKTCNERHHSLLHETQNANPAVLSENSENSEEQSISVLCSNIGSVLLPTALAKIKDSDGNYQSVRILLDSGSQSNFITGDLATKLAVPTHTVNISVYGINNSNNKIKSKCNLEIQSYQSNFKTNISCLILPKITGTTPGFSINHTNFKIPDNIKLSDPSYNKPGDIDLLIGSPIFFELLCVGQIKLGRNLPILQKTQFGWVIAGPTSACVNTKVECYHSTNQTVQKLISKFWELENYPTTRVLSAEEHECESHYVQTTKRDEAGRFIVSIPLKRSIESLGDSMITANRRLIAMERRLEANPDLSQQYSDFMKEYEALGHMTRTNSTASQVSYYMPHHAVQKADSVTTKLRVVFNASATTSTGISLNNIQMVGPTIQPFKSPQTLKESTLWWNGPPWLSKNEVLWPKQPCYNRDLPEMRNETKALIVSNPEPFPFSNYSNLSRTERIFAYVIRFRNNCKLNKDERTFGPLTPKEIATSLRTLVKIAQRETFKTEIMQFEKNKCLNSKSNLISLNPFLIDGLIRVGGRIQNSQFTYDKKHPILLAGKHYLTKLIVEREHIRLLHAGPQLLLSSLREKFWIMSGRNVVKQVVHKCIKCFRQSPRLTEPIMGNLPAERIQSNLPFSIVGIDYAGPIMIKDRKGRGAKHSKCYICLYICFSTKAVHIELVSDLTTESFMLSFRRFVSRRNKPSQVFSDNGTTFVGANSHLRELGNFIKKNTTLIIEAGTNEGVAWHFIPARSPHFGGLWEAGVKSCKYHLKRVIGNSILTFEELCTLLTQVEALLNSRPIAPLSNDPSDLQPLTPAHFLVGKPLLALPDPDVTHVHENRLASFQKIQLFHQHIWKRWNKEYISELQQRSKWRINKSNLQNGTLVLVKEDNLPPLKWKLARVIQLHPGKDGVNRVATIQTTNGICQRSFAKLCPLPSP